MARRYGPSFVSLAWPFLLWLALVLAVSALPAKAPGDIFGSPFLIIFIPGLLATTLVALPYAWVAVRSDAKPRVRYVATLLNLVPGLFFLWFVVLELL